MRIALAQINPTVGDIEGNTQKIITWSHRAQQQGADLVVFPELCLCGYPPQDLLERPFFLQRIEQAIEQVAQDIPADVGVIIGAPYPNQNAVGKRLFNAAYLLENGSVVTVVKKMLLPTYDVFDENRYFEPATRCDPITWRGLKLGLHICEDMWNNEENVSFHLYQGNPIDELAAKNADLFINISASPFYVGKYRVRNRLIDENAGEHHIPFVYVNQVGANTELVFDGNSRVHDATGQILAAATAFDEDLVVWDMKEPATVATSNTPEIESLYRALVMGIRDYFEKTGAFTKTLVGLSGGIDSAVTCALAVDALGPEKVVGVTMPSRYSSSGSVDDSRELAEAYGIPFHNIPIVPAVQAFDSMLAPLFEGTEPGVAEENIQARARGLTLMALSNKFNYLLLTTGNKSEMSVGYATLYGDMNGGLAVLADVFKMEVYALARFINENAGRICIPENTITKPPSAELRPDQKDTDSLPPYPILDEILKRYIEDHESVDTIARQMDQKREYVARITRMVDRNEYKRKQAPPGIRVSKKAFGIGRRLPIVMRLT